MRQNRPLFARILFLSLTSLALAAPVSAFTIYGVTSTNTLISFDSATPGTINSSLSITGLQPGESILGIDFRPATGQLYGLGSTSRSDATTAPIAAYAEERPFADVTMSGRMSYRSDANQ